MGRIIKKKTNTKILKEEVNSILYSIDDYIKGDIKDYNTKIITLDCTEEDIDSSLNEAIIFRQYFEVKDDNATVPVFFTCIEGVNENIAEYLKIFNTCNNLNNSMNIRDVGELLNDYFNSNNIINIFLNKIDDIFNFSERKYSKYFAKYENRFNVEKLINDRETSISKYSLDLQKYLLNKLNEYINDSSILNKIEDRYKIRLLYAICNLSDEMMIKLSNFNIEKVSPKIVLFLEKENYLDKLSIALLGYFRYLGVDIVIFTPAASANLELVLNERLFSKIKLKVVSNTVSYDLLLNISSYLEKLNISINELGEDFKYLGYNSDFEVYKNKIRMRRHPILNRISNSVEGNKLILIGSIGIAVSIVCMIVNILNNAMMIVGLIFLLILLLGFITANNDK